MPFDKFFAIFGGFSTVCCIFSAEKYTRCPFSKYTTVERHRVHTIPIKRISVIMQSIKTVDFNYSMVA